MSEQDSLFDADPSWKEAWGGMPEFDMGNTEPIQRITVNFKSMEDVKRFGELIGQKLTSKTDSVWFPKQDWIPPKTMRYVDES